MPSVFVGLDCGGSSSRVLAIDSEGNIVFRGQSGAANLTTTPGNHVRKNLARATEGCPESGFVCGCFAGLIDGESRKQGEDHLRVLFPKAKVRAEPDFVAALFASPSETDVCVIAGTGSLVCSRTPSGIAKSGGFGPILGDEGSGFQYGRDALSHYVRDPSKATEGLQLAIRDTFGELDVTNIVAAVYATSTPAPLLAKLATALGLDAAEHVPYAVESVRRNSLQLASVVIDHVARYVAAKSSLAVCLAGGLWKGSPVFQNELLDILRMRAPDREVHAIKMRRPPVEGAVALAREMSIGN